MMTAHGDKSLGCDYRPVDITVLQVLRVVPNFSVLLKVLFQNHIS